MNRAPNGIELCRHIVRELGARCAVVTERNAQATFRADGDADFIRAHVDFTTLHARKRSRWCAVSLTRVVPSSACVALAAIAACSRVASDHAVTPIPAEVRSATITTDPRASASATRSANQATTTAAATPHAHKRLAARFEFPTARGGEARPQALLACDLDGDGKDELVACTTGPGAVQIWSGLTAEIAAAPQPRSIEFGDFPLGPVWLGGKKPASKTAPALAVVASRLTLELAAIDVRAAFAAAPGTPAPFAMRAKLESRPRVIASGDIDGIGTNLIAAVTIDDDLVLATNDKDARHMRLSDDHATCARFLDDASGIVLGFQGTRRVVIYVKSAMSKDVNPIGLEPGPAVELPGLPRALDEVDLDGDGDTELVVAGGDKSLWVFGLARAGGWKTWFDAPPIEIETSTVPMDVAHADFDRDGKTDLVSLGLHGQECSLYSGASFAALRDAKSAASPTSPTSPTSIDRRWRVYAGQQSMWSAVGDFDGDGALDVAVSNAAAKRVSVLFGDGRGGVYTAESATSGKSPSSIAAGDLDGDGYPEIVGINALEGTLSVFKNEKGRLQAGVVQGQAPSSEAVPLRCADVDGDGKVDVILRLQANGVSSLVTLYGDGSGRLSARVPPIAMGSSSGDLLAIDLSGAGETLAIAADPAKDIVNWTAVWDQSPAKHSVAVPSMPLSSGPRAFALVSKLPSKSASIAVALGGPGEPRGVGFLKCVHGDGKGVQHLEPGDKPLEMSLYPVSIAAADLDGDGENDLAVLATQSGGDSQGFVVPCLHAKDGSWRMLDPLPTGQRPYRIVAGDLDGDGRAEILVSAQNSHHVNLWTSSGASFVRCADVGVGIGPLDLLLVDLDRDGTPEIVTANSFNNELTVIRVR